VGVTRWVGRAVGLDVHREFCEVAICEDGQTRSVGRVPATPDGIRMLGESLLATDRVALEVTGSCWEVTRLLEPHVNRVVVVSPDDTGITSARAKTDKLDARALAGLLWRGELEAVWMPDERCRILRRRLARREQLVRSRTRSKNEIHASLQRRLQGKPPCSDLFGVKGRLWLVGLELPPEERESVDAGLRHIEFLDAEIAAVERLIAQQALSWQARSRQSDRRHRPQARGPVLVHAHPLRGLRPPTALADQEEAPAPGDHRRRTETHLPRRWSVVDQRADARRRTRARPPSRNLLQADGPGPAGRSPSKKSGRERDTAASKGLSHPKMT
jgi:Transposase